MSSSESPAEDTGSHYPRRLYLIFAALAMVSCLGLDFLAARRGEHAFLFPSLRPDETPPAAAASLADIAGQILAQNGIAERDIRRTVGEDSRPRLAIRLSREAYSSLAPTLQSVFKKHGAAAEIVESAQPGQTTYSWSILRGGVEGLAMDFACALPPPEKKEEPVRTATPRPAAPEKIAAIVIDDMGDSLEALQEICDFGAALTISVLPESPYAEETAQTAHDHGLEVLLHLPGESLNHQEANLAPVAVIRSDMPPDEIRAFVLSALAKVPFATGVNNHMGSKITQEVAVMDPILSVLKEKGLFFLDSRTGDRSIAYDEARKLGLRSTYRNVFLDSKVGVDYSRKRLVELFKLAQKRGRAVAIGHPFPETLQALRNNLPLLRKYGVKLVPVSRIIPD